MKKCTCRFCGVRREEGNFRRTRNKETLLIMLCVMLELDKVGLLHAQDVYNECKQCRKTICKSHYNEAASYIADAVAVMCENAGRDFFSAPGLIEIEVVTRLEPHRVAIDANCQLTAAHLATFHREFTKGWKREIPRLRERKSDIVNSSALDAIRNFPMDIQSTSIASAENQVAVQPHSGVKPRIPGGLAAFHKTRKRKEPPVRITEYPSTADSNTQNMIPSGSGVCSDNILKLDETDPKLLDEDFLITGSQLLKLFRFCPLCGSKLSESMRSVSLTSTGTTPPVVHYICTACVPFEKRFEGLEEADFHPQEVPSDLQTSIASTTMNTGDVESQQHAEVRATNDAEHAPLHSIKQEDHTDHENGLECSANEVSKGTLKSDTQCKSLLGCSS